MEELLENRPYIDRLSAMLVASDYAKHKAGKPNRFKDSHARHYEVNFRDLIFATSQKLSKTLDKVKIADNGLTTSMRRWYSARRVNAAARPRAAISKYAKTELRIHSWGVDAIPLPPSLKLGLIASHSPASAEKYGWRRLRLVSQQRYCRLYSKSCRFPVVRGISPLTPRPRV